MSDFYIDWDGCLAEHSKMEDVFSDKIELTLDEKIAFENFYSEKKCDFSRVIRVFQCNFIKFLETGIFKNVLSIDTFIQSASDDEALGDINITIRDGYAEVLAIGETFEIAAKTIFSQRCWASCRLDIYVARIVQHEYQHNQDKP